MVFEKIERLGGHSFWFSLTNAEIQDLEATQPGCLDSHHFYQKSIYEILEHLVRIQEYLDDIRYDREEWNEVRP
jgi:hypothetical protein